MIPGWGRSPGERKGYLVQYSSLENSMDWIVHWVAKGWARLSNVHSLFHLGYCSFHPHTLRISGCNLDARRKDFQDAFWLASTVSP